MLLLLPTSTRSWWRDGKKLQAASRAPVHPAWEASHLRVSAFAGVRTYSVWQGAYLTEGLQKHSAKEAAAVAACRVAAVGMKRVHLTKGADKGVRIFHVVSSGL